MYVKTTKKAMNHIGQPTKVKMYLVEVQMWLIKLNNKVFITVDVMFIKKSFMVSVLREI